MRALVIVGGFLLSAAAPTQPRLSPQAQALIAPVHAAYAQVDAEQAKLPPPKDDRERLERLGDIDQAGRSAYVKVDLSVLPKADQTAADSAVAGEIIARDYADQQALKVILARDGWITVPKYGKKASMAAFLIVQHAVNDPDFMRQTLALLGPLAAKGEVSSNNYALMYDRVAIEFDHKPQRYGTQLHCVGGHWRLIEPLEDPAALDARRESLGLLPEAEGLKTVSDARCH